jgi:hypothetical protein
MRGALQQKMFHVALQLLKKIGNRGCIERAVQLCGGVFLIAGGL